MFMIDGKPRQNIKHYQYKIKIMKKVVLTTAQVEHLNFILKNYLEWFGDEIDGTTLNLTNRIIKKLKTS